jgi:hypothetical protein
VDAAIDAPPLPVASLRTVTLKSYPLEENPLFPSVSLGEDGGRVGGVGNPPNSRFSIALTFVDVPVSGVKG